MSPAENVGIGLVVPGFVGGGLWLLVTDIWSVASASPVAPFGGEASEAVTVHTPADVE